jgi:DNA-binding PadR family transcriptional regulator
VTRFAVLALLREQSDYGYRLKQRFEGLVGPAWKVNVGQIYQTLRALERRGQVAELRDGSRESASAKRYPERTRRCFEITPKGTQALDRWLSRPATAIQPMRDEMVVRLLVLGQRRADVFRKLLEARERSCRKHLDRLLVLRAKLSPIGGEAPLSPRLALEGQILQVSAYLDWLALCSTSLPGEPPKETAPPPKVPTGRRS